MNNVICPNCEAVIPNGRASCNSCGTPTPNKSSGAFCANCGCSLPNKYAQCTQCGHTKTTLKAPPHSPTPPHNTGAMPYNMLYKNEGTVLILAIILGLFALNGIGHLYLGKIARGVGLLIGSIVLLAIGFATLFFGIGAILLIFYFILFIWQIIDARNICRQYNTHVQATGRAPDNW